MNFTETIFLIAFVVCVLLFLYKLFNLLTFGRLSSIYAVVISFVTYLISFGVGFVVVLFNKGDVLIYNTFFTLLSWLTSVFVFFFVIELILFFSSQATNNDAYNSLERRRRGF